MSWDGYVNDQLLKSGHVKDGAILGHDGKTWATSKGFAVSADEGKFINSAFTDASVARASGMKVNGEKYFILRTDNDTIYAKKGTKGLCLIKTKKALCLGLYEEPKQTAGQCNSVVGKMADVLKDKGY